MVRFRPRERGEGVIAHVVMLVFCTLAVMPAMWALYRTVGWFFKQLGGQVERWSG